MRELVAARVARLSRIGCAAIALLVFVGDQATKSLVERALPEHALVPILPGFFNLTHVKNAGAAFGLFSDPPALWKTALLVAVSLALVATVVGILWKSRPLPWETSVGLALILGGALSNLLDRIRMGLVVDFLDFHLGSYHWPAFNLADSAIVVGAGFLILELFLSD